MDVSKEPGLRRVDWNLRGDPPRRHGGDEVAAEGRGGGRGGGAGGPGGGAAGGGRAARRCAGAPAAVVAVGGAGARRLTPGRYTRDARQDDGRPSDARSAGADVPRAPAAGEKLLIELGSSLAWRKPDPTPFASSVLNVDLR